MQVEIRALNPEDLPALRDLRLRALREHPEAFATSEAEERERSPEELARRLAPALHQVTLGAFDRDRLVGFVALTRSTRIRQHHRATLTAMYVAPEARGAKLGRALLEQALAIAREWGVMDVALAVTVGNREARALYAAAGFLSYGVEPRGLNVEGRLYDVELMNLQLGQQPAS